MNTTETMTIETITPERAKALLVHNVGNRPIKRDRIYLYAADMAAGKWQLTGDPIVLDESGRVMQGQHRLLACVQSNVSFRTAMLYDADEAAYGVMDSGVGRTPGDGLAHLGIDNAVNKAAAARVVLQYRAGWFNERRSASITRSAIHAEVLSRPDDYTDAVARAKKAYKACHLNQSAFAGFIIITYDAPDMTEFVYGVTNGTGLDDGDPKLALRSWAINAFRMTAPDHLSAIIRAWNAELSGQQLKHIKRWVKGTPFPTLTPWRPGVVAA